MVADFIRIHEHDNKMAQKCSLKFFSNNMGNRGCSCGHHDRADVSRRHGGPQGGGVETLSPNPWKFKIMGAPKEILTRKIFQRDTVCK